MIKRRIHTLHATVRLSQEPYQDEKGNMVFPPDKEVEITRPCRAESGSREGERLVKDGVVLEYSYIIFTDAKIPAIPFRTKVRVTSDATGEVFGAGEVVYFERGQRISRIWIS